MSADEVGVDPAAALAWAEEVIGPVATVRALSGGWTSAMLSLASRDGRRAVLRLMTHDPWRRHGAELTTRECETQTMLAATPVPAPLSLALDADGERCGVPAHLMTHLPGRLETSHADPASLAELAGLLATVHEVVPATPPRDYQSWAGAAKWRIPPWSDDAGLWTAAFDVLDSEPPAADWCFLHRDFQPRNVLWHQGRVSGLVDWVETSRGQIGRAHV